MIKKMLYFLTGCCLFVLLSWQFNWPVLAQNQTGTTIALQHQVVNQTKQRTRFDVYDMSNLAAAHRQDPHYNQTLKTQAQTIQTIIQDQHLALVDSQVTDALGQLVFHVPQAGDKTYLIVQRQPDTITQNKGEIPLSAVRFVLYQRRQRQKYYLTQTGDWCQSTTPKQDSRVKKILSDSRGLVILQDYQLPAGRYFFEEVQTQPNYLISSAAQAIQLDVPAVADNTPLSPMRLNGEPLWQTAAGQLPNQVMTTAKPRVINAQKQATTQLPATGQAKAMMSLIGLTILVMSFLLLAGLYTKRGLNHEK
ncbi:SpaA isopeptide-forming pilin-related protein [uncultured Leuconostoc sp.]|uniref:SpaA isopeptide-forming pilin-related protein n=1 Tax=uncultured Leuconostoc sp. TaxID=173262 RepID=UPI00258263BC|nr:SpaA isopeptide-forming pilin-related protein [uncultured Leuconostoc sp.]